MTDTPETLPTDLKVLIESNRKLAALIEPLQMMLALDRSPGMPERLEAFMSELSAIREQMQRASLGALQTCCRTTLSHHGRFPDTKFGGAGRSDAYQRPILKDHSTTQLMS